MEYEMDPTFTTPMMMTQPMEKEENPMDKPKMKPEVLSISAPKFNLVLPFASFDRSSPTKYAGSILNWTALIACFIWVFLLGKYGFMSGKSMSVFIIAIIFTIATTVILSTSGYQRR